MTAGTDPEPAEPSRAVKKMPSIMQISHIPYLDHNYGQPPPMTPPDSNSPGPDDVDTGNEEDERNAITRCICGFNHDDGYMICCDKCSVWQHIECMGISSESLPDNYLCEQCEPRQLDMERAKGIQMKKREELSDDDDDDDESAEEADGTTYTAFSNTPTRITLTAKVSQGKRKTGGPKVKGEKDKDKKTKRKKRKEYTRQRIPTDFIPVDEETNGPWENNSNRVDYYQEAKECTYSPVVQEFAVKLAQTNQVRCLPDGLEQLCKVVEVQKNTKGLVATEDLYKDQFLIKVKGKMMLCSEFDEENPMFRRYNPYVLFYNNNPDCLKLCVDARVFGNEARFIRRSCTPNAEVRHVLQNGKLNLAVFSVNPLPKGSEITIPFEFAFADYLCSLTCACAQDTCAVAKYKLKCQVSGQEMNSIPEQNGHKVCDDSSNSSHNPLLRTALSTQNSIQGDSDSDADNTHEKINDSEARRKKLSREERKLEAYVKQIERLEKKEKKRQQPQKEHRQILRTVSSDEGSKTLMKGVRCAKRLNHKRRSNGATSCLKKKRARISSCSSEPLSPDEASSTASTPTTPKPVSTIPEESLTETPSTSPSRNFRFPKAKMDENSHDGITSALSSPTSPCSPRESENEAKPTLSTASSNSDIAMAIDMEESESVRFEETCDGGSVDQQGDLSNDLSVRLAEISNASRSECNSPSPCPSSSASPTRSESVMNGCNIPCTMVGGRSPGPAPGTPLAALIHGAQSTRTNPLYFSLKKRWLYKFLSGQNGVGLGRPVNGVRNLMLGEKHKPVTAVNHNTYREPLPLKKRYLRKVHSSPTQVNSANLQVKTETTTSSLPTTNETKINELTNSTNDSDKFIKNELDMQVSQSPIVVQQDTKQTRTLENDSRTLLPSQELTEGPLHPLDSMQQSYISRGTLGTVPDIKPVVISSTPVQRISDPRQHSPSSASSSQNSLISQQSPASVPSTPTSTITNDSTLGTPGKKKVSLREYRNRAQQRLSGDGPKPSLITTNTTSTTTTSPAAASKPSTTSTSPSNHISNGPSVEPISPEEDERYINNRFRIAKMAHSPLYEAKLNSIVKKEAGVTLFNKKLSALISEQLLSDPANSPSSSKSPSTASNSPSVPPPPPPPQDSAGKAGDAMDIEEDGPSDPKIYISAPLVSSSRPQLQTPNQHTLIAEYGRPHHSHQIPDYRTHDHHPHVQSSLLTPMIQASTTQLPGQISPQSSHLQTRVSASPYHLSQGVPSQIRFPATYQNPSVPNGPYYQQ